MAANTQTTPSPKKKQGVAPGDTYHTYLILSQADSTMVLQTGQEITELDGSGFATQAPTIFAGNMAEGRYIVQVWAWGGGVGWVCGVNLVWFMGVCLSGDKY